MNKILYSFFFITGFCLLMFFPVEAIKKTVPLSKSEKELLTRSRIEVPTHYIEAHNFEGRLPSGETAKLSDYDGKFLLLNFWATWCNPCLKEMPDLDEAYQILGKHGLAVIAVNMGEDGKRVGKFLKTRLYSSPVITDPEMTITRLYGVQNIPITYLIDPSGAILGRALGPRKWSVPELLEFFRSRLRGRAD